MLTRGRTTKINSMNMGNEETLLSNIFTLAPTLTEVLTRISKIADHVGKTFRNGSDVKRSTDALKKVTIPPP